MMGWRCHAEPRESLAARLVFWPQTTQQPLLYYVTATRHWRRETTSGSWRTRRAFWSQSPPPLSLSRPSSPPTRSSFLWVSFSWTTSSSFPSFPRLKLLSSPLLSFTHPPLSSLSSPPSCSHGPQPSPSPSSPCRHLVAQSQQSLLQERRLLSVLALFILSAGSAWPLPPDNGATHTTNVIDRTGQTSFQRPAGPTPSVCINLLAAPPAARATVMNQTDLFGFSSSPSVARASFHLHLPPSTSFTLSHWSLATLILRHLPSCSTISLTNFCFLFFIACCIFFFFLQWSSCSWFDVPLHMLNHDS